MSVTLGRGCGGSVQLVLGLRRAVAAASRQSPRQSHDGCRRSGFGRLRTHCHRNHHHSTTSTARVSSSMMLQQKRCASSSAAHFEQHQQPPGMSEDDDEVLRQKIDYYCMYNPSPLSLQALTDFGQKEVACQQTSFAFLRKELCVRLSNIMKEISLLPDTLLHTSSVRQVQTWYEESMRDVLRFEHLDKGSDSVLMEFADTMVKIRNRHSNVVETMAHGVIEMKETYGDVVDNATESSVQYFLDRFYMSRISIRMLINQHALLFGNTQP